MGEWQLESLLDKPNPCPFRMASTRFLARPRRFSNFDVSIEAARLRIDLPKTN